jgi:hypothetical protein
MLCNVHSDELSFKIQFSDFATDKLVDWLLRTSVVLRTGC